MRTRLKKILAGIGALAALALGGAAISQAGNSTPHQRSSEPATEQEQSAPENSATDRDNVQDENGKDERGKNENGKDERNNENRETGNHKASGKAKKGEADKLLTGGAVNRARQAAAAKTGGTAGDVENGGDRGVAYEVEVTKAGGKKFDVYVNDQYKVVAVNADNETERAAEQARRDK
jgi:hypothetical protein